MGEQKILEAIYAQWDNALGRALKGSKARRAQILKTEGDKPKSTMEMRKACLQQRSDWPQSLSKNQKGAAIA